MCNENHLIGVLTDLIQRLSESDLAIISAPAASRSIALEVRHRLQDLRIDAESRRSLVLASRTRRVQSGIVQLSDHRLPIGSRTLGWRKDSHTSIRADPQPCGPNACQDIRPQHDVLTCCASIGFETGIALDNRGLASCARR